MRFRDTYSNGDRDTCRRTNGNEGMDRDRDRDRDIGKDRM